MPRHTPPHRTEPEIAALARRLADLIGDNNGVTGISERRRVGRELHAALSAALGLLPTEYTVAQRDAVLALHRQGIDSSHGELVGDGECVECDSAWPCRTVQALVTP